MLLLKLTEPRHIAVFLFGMKNKTLVREGGGGGVNYYSTQLYLILYYPHSLVLYFVT